MLRHDEPDSILILSPVEGWMQGAPSSFGKLRMRQGSNLLIILSLSCLDRLMLRQAQHEDE
jgi:hypothetical protein